MRVAFSAMAMVAVLNSVTVNAAPPGPVPTPRDVPQDGRGLLVVGTAVATLGVVGLSTGVATSISSVTVGDAPFVIPTVAFIVGGGFASLGGVLLHAGVKHRREYKAWEATQPDKVPRQGNGLLATGGVLMAGGIWTSIVGAVVWSENSGYGGGPPPGGVTMVAIGLSTFATSYAPMGAGAYRNKRFHAWRRGTHVDLLPSASASPHGFSLGVAGRF